MDGEPQANQVIDFFDAFCGIGGIRLGVERAARRLGIGVRCVGSADIDEPARRVYTARFGQHDYHAFHTDVRGVNGASQRPFRLFLGGFPCQTFSSVGARQGFMDQVKGTLFFECARIIQEFQPKGFLLENVKGLTTHDGGRTLKIIAGTFDELGYDFEWQLINARHLLPQDRERIYLVGHRRPHGEGWSPVFPFGLQEVQAFRARLDKEKLQAEGELRRNERCSKSCKNIVSFDNKQEGFFGNRHIRTVGEPTATLITDEGTGFIQSGKARYATEIERERLMGFEDDWTRVDGPDGKSLNPRRERIKQTGNAVAVPVIEMIMERLLPNLVERKGLLTIQG